MRVLGAITLVVSLGSACGGTSGGPESSAVSVAVIYLQPSASPEAAPATVTVPADSAQVQIRLAGLDRPAQELTAEIERAGSDQIRRWSVDDVPAEPERGAHAVVVPAYEAQPGEYVLRVWASDVEILRSYRFRIEAK